MPSAIWSFNPKLYEPATFAIYLQFQGLTYFTAQMAWARKQTVKQVDFNLIKLLLNQVQFTLWNTKFGHLRSEKLVHIMSWISNVLFRKTMLIFCFPDTYRLILINSLVLPWLKVIKGSSDYVAAEQHFPRYWPFVQGIHWSPVNSLHKGQWRGALMFSLICAWINDLLNNG